MELLLRAEAYGWSGNSHEASAARNLRSVVSVQHVFRRRRTCRAVDGVHSAGDSLRSMWQFPWYDREHDRIQRVQDPSPPPDLPQAPAPLNCSMCWWWPQPCCCWPLWPMRRAGLLASRKSIAGGEKSRPSLGSSNRRLAVPASGRNAGLTDPGSAAFCRRPLRRINRLPVQPPTSGTRSPSTDSIAPRKDQPAILAQTARQARVGPAARTLAGSLRSILLRKSAAAARRAEDCWAAFAEFEQRLGAPA